MKAAWAEMFEPGHVRASLHDCIGAYRRRALTTIALGALAIERVIAITAGITHHS